jgi:hypothetical protein
MTGQGSIGEFAPAMFILFVIVFLPLIGLLTFVDGAATLYFATAQAARAAGPSNTEANAVANMNAAADTLLGGPLGAFARLSPADHTGMSLTVLEVSIANQTTSNYNPLNGAPDTTKNFYEFQVTSNYTCAPFFFPGKPIPLSFSSSCNVEHPEGLTVTAP